MEDSPKFESAERHFDATLVLSWRVGLEALGIPTIPLLKAAGLSEHTGFRDERVTLTAFNQLINGLDRLHGKRAWGVLVAEQSSVYMLGLLGMLTRNSANIMDVFARLTRFRGLVQEVCTTILLQSGNNLVVRAEYTVPEGSIARAAIEYAPASAIIAIRALIGDPAAIPKRVSFRHPHANDGDGAIERVFGTDVRFGAEHDEIVFPQEIFERPILGAIPSLLSALDSHADAVVGALPPVGRFETVVRAQIAQVLSNGSPSVQVLAKRLRMSVRTLQRRLANEGASVRDLTEKTRHQMAVEMLTNSAHPLAQIAFLTGFSDHSGFHRAFVRWEGVTPGDFRKAGREGNAG